MPEELETTVHCETEEGRQVLTAACLYAIAQMQGGKLYIDADLLEHELNEPEEAVGFSLKAVTDSLYLLELRKIPMGPREQECTSSESTPDSPEQ